MKRRPRKSARDLLIRASEAPLAVRIARSQRCSRAYRLPLCIPRCAALVHGACRIRMAGACGYGRGERGYEANQAPCHRVCVRCKAPALQWMVRLNTGDCNE